MIRQILDDNSKNKQRSTSPNKNDYKLYEKLLEKHLKQWNGKSQEDVIQELKFNEMVELIERRLYTNAYDDKNNRNYTIISEKLDVEFELFLIPVITVFLSVKEKKTCIDVDAITREVLKRPEPLIKISDETKSLLIDSSSEALGSVAPGSGPVVKKLFNYLKR